MSAETTGQNAPGGEDLRARYLPVSRKELRRRREAELSSATPDSGADSPEELESLASAESAPSMDTPGSAGSAATPDSTAWPAAATSEAADGTDAPGHAVPAEDHAEDELSRLVEDAGAVEAADLADAPSADDAEIESARESEVDPDATTLIDAAQIAAYLEDTAPGQVALPKPSVSEEPARPEEEFADATEADFPAAGEAVEAPEADLPELDSPEESEPAVADRADEYHEDAESSVWDDDGGHGLAEDASGEEAPGHDAQSQDAESEVTQQEGAEGTGVEDPTPGTDAAPGGEVPDVELDAEDIALLTAGEPEEDFDEEAFEDFSPTDPAEQDEYVDPHSGPIPASRRARRLLKDTESIPAMDPELLAELNHTTQEIAAMDDPDRVDPELLKRQQALAAKAMQANQERVRKQQVEQERAARRLRRERPESQVITTKTVRRSLDIDPEDVEYYTGQIEPVHAQGAHGLDLKKLLEATSRQTDRQSMLQWLVVILAVLLVVAVGVVIFALSR